MEPRHCRMGVRTRVVNDHGEEQQELRRESRTCRVGFKAPRGDRAARANACDQVSKGRGDPRDGRPFMGGGCAVVKAFCKCELLRDAHTVVDESVRVASVVRIRWGCAVGIAGLSNEDLNTLKLPIEFGLDIVEAAQEYAPLLALWVGA